MLVTQNSVHLAQAFGCLTLQTSLSLLHRGLHRLPPPSRAAMSEQRAAVPPPPPPLDHHNASQYQRDLDSIKALIDAMTSDLNPQVDWLLFFELLEDIKDVDVKQWMALDSMKSRMFQASPVVSDYCLSIFEALMNQGNASIRDKVISDNVLSFFWTFLHDPFSAYENKSRLLYHIENWCLRIRTEVGKNRLIDFMEKLREESYEVPFPPQPSRIQPFIDENWAPPRNSTYASHRTASINTFPESPPLEPVSSPITASIVHCLSTAINDVSPELDWQAAFAVVDLVDGNSNSPAVLDAIRFIRERILSPNSQIVEKALCILDILISNCKPSFRKLALSSENVTFMKNFLLTKGVLQPHYSILVNYVQEWLQLVGDSTDEYPEFLALACEFTIPNNSEIDSVRVAHTAGTGSAHGDFSSAAVGPSSNPGPSAIVGSAVVSPTGVSIGPSGRVGHASTVDPPEASGPSAVDTYSHVSPVVSSGVVLGKPRPLSLHLPEPLDLALSDLNALSLQSSAQPGSTSVSVQPPHDPRASEGASSATAPVARFPASQPSDPAVVPSAPFTTYAPTQQAAFPALRPTPSQGTANYPDPTHTQGPVISQQHSGNGVHYHSNDSREEVRSSPVSKRSSAASTFKAPKESRQLFYIAADLLKLAIEKYEQLRNNMAAMETHASSQEAQRSLTKLIYECQAIRDQISILLSNQNCPGYERLVDIDKQLDLSLAACKSRFPSLYPSPAINQGQLQGLPQKMYPVHAVPNAVSASQSPYPPGQQQRGFPAQQAHPAPLADAQSPPPPPPPKDISLQRDNTRMPSIEEVMATFEPNESRAVRYMVYAIQKRRSENPDELSLDRVGDVFTISIIYGDGWAQATSQRTGQTGMVPINFFVQMP
ncbi:uncharacterized protein BJ171DRAFT_155268 [Polychytrium aggregatum]|uniref:uncharacterized protein n=1 Tax=Polychytrium aggregatum TaxID=110093 RepID=UPI0022FED472|nr:uncharacterized protein BJ171DRAFT_155268 [Polychytrium aggregatum]KAI9203235.1 hypothetical protein BJ171DRAFT_155268 [Polychytrium aggregatum]